MQKKPCPIEPLISSKYCQLSVCLECNIVNLNLPGRISFQLDTTQFIEISHAFSQSAALLKEKLKPNQQNAKIIKLNHLH